MRVRELIEVAGALKGDEAKALKDAYQQPSEEEKEVKTAIGAARAKQARKEML